MTTKFPNIFARAKISRSKSKHTFDMIETSGEERRVRKEKECIFGLREYCRTSNVAVSESLLFRFACFHDFDLEKAKAGVARTREKNRIMYLNLRMVGDLQEYFYRRVIFPLKGLIKTKSGHEMEAIYFRPARFLAGQPSDHKNLVESLHFVMNDLSRTEDQSKTGIALIINLAGHTHKNFHHPTVANFLKGIQGEWVPTKVNLCIFVDPPILFKGYWKFCKGIFSTKFCKKVHQVKSSKLSTFFEPGFEEYLPHELARGSRYIDEEVDDYIDLKVYEDQARAQDEIVWNEQYS